MGRIMVSFMTLFLAFPLVASAEARLQATVELAPAYPPGSTSKELQPNTPAIVRTRIQNTGTSSSAEGSVWVRFMLPASLTPKNQGMSFKTEEQRLPSIPPQQEEVVTFTTPQQLPDISETLKKDWPKHLYETVVSFDSKEYVIGQDTITYSAHYYMGPNKPQPKETPVRQ